MTDNLEVRTCDQCLGPAYLCEHSDSTCRLKEVARGWLEARHGVYFDEDFRSLARLLRSGEDGAWERLSVTRTRRIAELEAINTATQASIAQALRVIQRIGLAHDRLEGLLATVRCGRCGAIKGTHGSPCIDDRNHDASWTRYATSPQQGSDDPRAGLVESNEAFEARVAKFVSDGAERVAESMRRRTQGGTAAHRQDRDFTVSASTDAVIIALLRRLRGLAEVTSGPVSLTANELARAEQVHLERRADGHKLELWVVSDT